jgi:hypothetical protein
LTLPRTTLRKLRELDANGKTCDFVARTILVALYAIIRVDDFVQDSKRARQFEYEGEARSR